MKLATSLSLLAIASALSACGGGSAPLTKEQIAGNHLGVIAHSNLDAPSTAIMPVNGTASYTGSFGIGSNLEPNAFAVGDATVEADFAVGSMIGTAENFLYGIMDEEGVVAAEAYEGSLALSGNFAGHQGLMTVTGTLEDADVQGVLLTDFKGTSAQTLLGIGTGTIDATDVNMYLATFGGPQPY